MARYTPGPMASAVSGSVGGSTFTRNKYGAMIRRRAVPVDPRGSSQLLQRSHLEQLAGDWKNLTQAERDAWETYSTSVESIDALGQTVEVSGISAYVQVNFRLLLCELPARNMPPGDPPWYDPDNVSGAPSGEPTFDGPYFFPNFWTTSESLSGFPEWRIGWERGTSPVDEWNFNPPEGTSYSDYMLICWGSVLSKPGRVSSFNKMKLIDVVEASGSFNHQIDELLGGGFVSELIGHPPNLQSGDPKIEEYKMAMRLEILHKATGALVYTRNGIAPLSEA